VGERKVIDPKTLTPGDVGKLVRYTPLHGETETGSVSGWNEEYIFVRYGGSLTGKATSPEQLEWITEYRLAFRGYIGGEKVFEEFATIPEGELDQVMPRLAIQHATALAEAQLHMIEIEFLDEPNPEERFSRFGTDPSGMVRPIPITLKPPTVH
jgi:hypothetical protein